MADKRPFMENIAAFTLILLVWFTGELLSRLIYNVITIPGSILGFIIMFILLQLGIVKLEFISATADFFLRHITLFLIPLAVSLIRYFKLIGSNILLLLLTGIVVTIISLALTMKFVDFLVKAADKRRPANE